MKFTKFEGLFANEEALRVRDRVRVLGQTFRVSVRDKGGDKAGAI